MAQDSLPQHELEFKLQEYFWGITAHLSGRMASVQMMRDANFNPGLNSRPNDVHAFFELFMGGYFHLRAYTRHMLTLPERAGQGAFLTGYHQPDVTLHGTIHALRQSWYPWDPVETAQQILGQNEEKFPLRQAQGE